MNYNWGPYAIGGATRPDSFSGMVPEFQGGLYDLLQAADTELGTGLQVYSGYRSPELQKVLYDKALKKYGSEKAARKWVAPPGKSRHNTGQAADLKWNGVRIDQLPEDHPVRTWLPENASRFGLDLPMSWEPWQVELAGARQGLSFDKPKMDEGIIRTEAAPELSFDFPEPQVSLQDLAEKFLTPQEPQAAPMPVQPRVQQLQLAQRDTTAPYLSFFQSLTRS